MYNPKVALEDKNTHKAFLKGTLKGTLWLKLIQLQGYISQRHLPGARRAANPESGHREVLEFRV